MWIQAGLSVLIVSLSTHLNEFDVALHRCQDEVSSYAELPNAQELSRFDRTQTKSRRAKRLQTDRSIDRLDELVRINPAEALRALLKAQGKTIEPLIIERFLRGQSLSQLSKSQAALAYHTLVEELDFAPTRALLRKQFPGYYAQHHTYRSNEHGIRVLSTDVALHRTDGMIQTPSQSAVFLDTSLIRRNRLQVLFNHEPEFESKANNFVLLPGVAYETSSNSPGDQLRNAVFTSLSPKFINPLSSQEQEIAQKMTEEFDRMKVGVAPKHRHDASESTMDARILVEAILAASESKNRTAEFWTRDLNFFEPLWADAKHFQIPIEGNGYSFELKREIIKTKRSKIPAIRIITHKPVKSNLLVIHPYLRLLTEDRIIHSRATLE